MIRQYKFRVKAFADFDATVWQRKDFRNMFMLRSMIVGSALLVLMLTACTAHDADVAKQSAGESDSTGASAPSPPAARLATKKPQELPVAIDAPSTSEYVAQAPVTEAVVHDAISKGMGAAGSDVNVIVKGGMVYLTGTVANQADFQAANYIARALPGVDEVDQTRLKVR
jgi:hypothetical protein